MSYTNETEKEKIIIFERNETWRLQLVNRYRLDVQKSKRTLDLSYYYAFSLHVIFFEDSDLLAMAGRCPKSMSECNNILSAYRK